MMISLAAAALGAAYFLGTVSAEPADRSGIDTYSERDSTGSIYRYREGWWIEIIPLHP